MFHSISEKQVCSLFIENNQSFNKLYSGYGKAIEAYITKNKQKSTKKHCHNGIRQHHLKYSTLPVLHTIC